MIFAPRFARFSRRFDLGAFVRVFPLLAAFLAALLVVGCQQHLASPLTSTPTPTPSRPETGTVRTIDLGTIEVRSGFLGITKRLEPVTMNLVYIRGGTFTMGSPKAEQDQAVRDGARRDWVELESPLTRVTLTEDFWMGETEVTQAQWKAVMGSENNPSRFKGDTLPVENVSWNDIMGEQFSGLWRPVPLPGSFMARLSQTVAQTSPSASSSPPDASSALTFTLPTEAKWEYACRAGSTTPFHFGETISTDQANFDGDYTYGSGRQGVRREKTTPVKSFPPNAWGLYDMHGNVWEWCSDWFSDKLPGDAITNPSGPSGPGPLSSRVFRGGSKGFPPWYQRSAARYMGAPAFRAGFPVGFRVVASSPKNFL